jgi:hypothetical protein
MKGKGEEREKRGSIELKKKEKWEAQEKKGRKEEEKKRGEREKK